MDLDYTRIVLFYFALAFASCFTDGNQHANECDALRRNVLRADSNSRTLDPAAHLTGQWSSQSCEQRPGAIHLLRHYKFFPRHSPSSPVKFKLRHYYYSNTGCTQPLYTLNIHGTYRVDEKSWVVPEGTQMSYRFHKVSVVGYSEAVVGELQHIINESCSGHLYSTWTPHRQYTIFLSNLETDGLFSSKPDGEQTTTPPVRNRQDLCLENVYRMFQDLDLLRIVHRPSNALDPYDRTKLYLGDLNVDIEQRKSHLPTAFQVPLIKSSTIQGCDVCECETQPLGMFVKRSLYVTLNNFTYETNLYAESSCTSLTMSITYRGDFHVTKLDLAGRTTPRKAGSSVTYEQRKHFVGTLDKLDEKKTQESPQFSVVPLVEMFANTRELLSQNALMREARLRHGPLKDNLYETVHISGHGTYETNRYSNEQFDRTFPGKSESLSEESVHQKGTFKGVDTLEDGNEPSEDQDNESVQHPKDSFESAAIEDKNGAAKKERLDAIEDRNQQKEGVIKTLRLQDTNDLEEQLYETGQGTNRRLKRIDTVDETRPIMDTSDEDYYKVLAELEAEGWPELGSNQRKRADFEDNLPTNDIDETTGEKSDEIVSRSDAKGDEETTAFEDTANKKDQTVSRVSNIDELLQTTDANQNRQDLIDLYDKTLDKTTGQLPKDLIDELLSRQTLRHKRHIKHGDRQHKHGHHEKLHRPKMENEPMYKKTQKEPFKKKNQMQHHDKTLLKEPFDTENNPKQHHDETLKKELAKKEEQPMAPEETLPKGPSDKEDETNSDKVLSAILPVVLDQSGVLLPHVKVNQMNPIDRKDLEYFVRQIGNGEHFRLPHHGHIAKEFDSDVKNAREGGNRLDKLDNNARNSKDNPTPHPKSKTDVTKHHTNQDQIQPTEPKHTHHSKRKHNHRQQEPTPNMPERILYWYNKPNIGRVPVVEKIGTMGLLNNPTKDTPKAPTEEVLDIQVDFSNNPGDANVQNDGNIVRNEGKIVKGDGNIVQNEGETEQNDGNIVQNEGNSVQNDGNVIQADGNIDQVEDNEYLVEFHIEAADLRLYDYDLIENLKYDQKCAARFQLWGTIIGDTIPLHSSCESIGIQLPHTEHTVAKLRLNRDQYALYLDQPEDNSATAHRIVNYHSLPLHKCKLFADDSYRNFGLRGILGVGFLKGVVLDQRTSVNDFEDFKLKEIDYEDEDEEGIDEPPDQIEMDYVVAQSGENGTDYESGVGQSGANALCVIAETLKIP
ncbi:hypothetical protein M8J75_002706 [Diaphorina citri]|nr:hypothetical protein M8J75_002706 [Diaphorina citri]